MYNLFFEKKHELKAVNLTSTQPPAPSGEAVPRPPARHPRGSKAATNWGGGGGGKTI